MRVKNETLNLFFQLISPDVYDKDFDASKDP